MNNINLFKPFFRKEEVLEEIEQCLDIGWTGIGYKTDQFEELWREYTQLTHCHFLNSATAGLHLAIKIFKDKFDWSEGDEILTSSMTFVSTNHAILYEALTPVFSDIDNSLCLDPVKLLNNITSKTKAVIYVGIGGNAANLREIIQICKDNNLILIVDAAHMAGTRWVKSNEHIGAEADCIIFSYQAVKNCPTSDSGAICFKEDELDQIARRISWLGISENTYTRSNKNNYKWDYDINELGYKYNGNSIAAAMAIVSLRYLDVDNEKRRSIADRYTKSFENSEFIRPILHDKKVISSRHLYQVVVEDRNRFIDHMSEYGISCGVHYKPNHNFSVYSRYKHTNLEVTDYIADRLVSFPLHLHLTDEEIKHISDTANKFNL